METISNAATAASKMIWGEQTAAQSGTEPISGQQGRGTVTDPFDAGNKEENPTLKERRSDSAHSHDEKPNLGMTPDLEPKKNVTAPSKPVEPIESQHKGHIGGGAIDPTLGADPKSAQKPTPKQQGADRPSDAPSDVQTDAIRAKKDDAEEDMKKPSGPTDSLHEDPLNKPMELPNSSSSSSGLGSPGAPTLPGAVQLPEDKKKDDEERGTGEKWVKTSGLAVDGGDFDAAKPGAGREADRLLESKGVRSPNDSSQDNIPAPHKERTPSPKQSMGQKIKEKLHIKKH